jgi:hypothetical protein
LIKNNRSGVRFGSPASSATAKVAQNRHPRSDAAGPRAACKARWAKEALARGMLEGSASKAAQPASLECLFVQDALLRGLKEET